MGADESSGSKYNVSFGDVTESQVVMGDYNTVSQKVGLSPQETAELRSVFGDLRSAVAEGAPPGKRDAALDRAAELERALVSEHPDPERTRSVLGWFRDNAPQLVGAVVSVVVNPLVGKVVEGAGKAIAGQFRELAEDES